MSRPIKIWMEGAVLRWSGLSRGVRFVQCAWPPHGETLEGDDILVVCEVKTSRALTLFIGKLTELPLTSIEITLPGMAVAAIPYRLEIARQMDATWRVGIHALITQVHEDQGRVEPWEPLSDEDLAELLYGPRRRGAQED